MLRAMIPMTTVLMIVGGVVIRITTKTNAPTKQQENITKNGVNKRLMKH